MPASDSPTANPSSPRSLSDARLRSLFEPGRYTDGTVPGLYLQVSKSGGKLWRLKYRLHGKEYVYAIGTYPAIGLKKARDLAWLARTEVSEGKHPLKEKKAKLEEKRLAEDRTFQFVAEQWLKIKGPKLVEKSLAGFNGALTNHIYPTLGQMAVADIKLEHISAVIGRLTGKGMMAMAKRCRTIMRAVLGFALGRSWVPHNVALGKSDELEISHVVTHSAALETPEELGRYLRRLETSGDGSVTQALRLSALLPCRPGELAVMRWEDTNLAGGDWRYVVGKTKHLSKEKHIVPLPTQALAILRELHESRVVNAKGEGWVFPSPVHPGEPINPTSLLKAAQRLWPDGKITAHGFRSVFRSMAHEHLGIDFVVLELMLSHKMPGPLGATYARAQLLKQRREAAQEWADYLDRLRSTPEQNNDRMNGIE
ncbi:tyrosine-type recombinase/integrase [Pseudomonas nunensis]|uniref:Site-specific integrase n=1 Tax=Pseudomonas nunensis TaxID=2961896 RepID=A0ABY5EQ93_9PSED|nr:site-specific integrase [Pseudomonas nunensis]KPN90677.1 integrase [Pseudomonas nunensis]MCL5228483.1 site-specific integrase [Pseudomonas nunensis]UTO16932.1 site-specific integrase [Pseudomonas nunensis]